MELEVDYCFTSEEEALRAEFAEFFEDAMKEAPQGWKGWVEGPYISDENWAFHCKMARKLAQRGWLTRTWPKEYGGLAAPYVEYVILNETAGYYRAPGIDQFGLHMIGTLLFLVGTEEQKKYFLPRMANAEVMWSQGWSEPDAGSDLSAINTTAIRKDDYYFINGQKTWMSSAHRADWAFVVVRTDPNARRSRGISVLLVDLKTPGISVDPIAMMDGSVSFNDVFFDNVKVPVENRLGEENKGWQVVRAIMDLERMGMANDIGQQQREVDDLVCFCKETSRDGELLIKNPIYRHQLAECTIGIKVARSVCYRLAWLVQKGEDTVTTSAYASALKLFTSETGLRLAYIGSEIMGQYGQVEQGSKWAPLDGAYEHMYQNRLGLLVAGGTSEIQRNIIAWTVLNLPRG
jgi:alkylation response protein AidB-like acyl-CoA dehydrogenase